MSWNIEWISRKVNESKEDTENRIEVNEKKSEVINDLVTREKLDVFALLEAGKEYAPEIKGYKIFFCDRKYMYWKY